jgi:hypothetical protein
VGTEAPRTIEIRPGRAAPIGDPHARNRPRAGHAADRRCSLPASLALKNRERLNRLLMLQQLHVNGEDDVLAYAKTIRAWLESNGDRPANRRCAIVDPAGSPSLR